MGVENNAIDANKINKSNSEDLYRPPALRTVGKETNERNVAEKKELTTNTASLNIETNKITSPTSSAESNTSAAMTTSLSCNNSPIHRNENGNTKNLPTSTHQSPTHKSQQQQPQRQSQARRERRPDRAVYIPRARRSQTTPPNTLITQLQSTPQEEEKQTTQLPALAPKTTSVTSKSINQQLAFALDDPTNVSVNKQPSNESHEVRKVNSDSSCNSTCSNNTTITTAIKKKEKLFKENKDSREQRLLRKLPSTSIERNEINKNLNELSKDKTNQELFGNAQRMQCSVPTNSVNNFSEVNDNIINFPKDINCDSSEVFLSDQEQQVSTDSTTIFELEFLEKSPANDTNAVINSSLNTSESEFLYRPGPRMETTCNISTSNTSTLHNAPTTKITIDNINIDTMPKPSTKIKSNNSEMLNQTKLPHLRIEDVASQQSRTKCDVEDQELLRASKEINRSNRRIIKQTFNSDVLQIPDHVNQENEHKSKLVESTNKSLTNTDEEDEEAEDDWENMYDDSGDCLDPKVMQELTASVGKCKIELPKMDYSAYLTKQSILNEEEFPHVLEVSNFPVEFKNQDLLMVFSQYKESGFDIKWVDDTHALAVFSSSRIAAEVLTLGHPFVVLKPLAEATLESRLKAKKCAASLQPYRPRPETCAALARRLVTGALGVRLKTAAAERENEKRVLREAKERKLLAAKQRDEIWES